MGTQFFQNPAAQSRKAGEAALVIQFGSRIFEKELGSGLDWSIGRVESGFPVPDIPVNSVVVARGIQGRFRFDRGAWFYEDDPHARNRTFRNGALMGSGPVRLENGDILRIDSIAKPHPEGVWILFSTVTILGSWERFSLTGKTGVTIGRDKGCDIVEALPYVSAHHARLERRGGAWYLSDLRSRDGTWLNGKKVTAPAALREKDWFSICDCHFILVNDSLVYNLRKPGDKPAERNRVLLTADILTKKVPDRTAPGGEKELLHDIHLEIREGTLVALLGVSGAGKSTLLNCLNGFDFSGVEGSVTYRGQNLYAQFERLKRNVGNVPQSNTFRDIQTVERELYYDAVLRLPGDTGEKEIQNKVNETLKTLNLEKQRETVLRKLSGGEQKRVNIGVELVADRQLLCLDEPDAGLDPMTKRELFKTLGNLAHREHKTILVIIHDVAEIRLFDQVIMLLKEDYRPQGAAQDMFRGRLAFSGTPDEAVRHFRQLSTKDPACTLTSFDGMADAYELVTKNPQLYIQAGPVHSGAVPAAPPHQGAVRDKPLSLPKEFAMSVRQFAENLVSDRLNLLISLLFPLAAALITVLVAGENMFVHYEGTKSACFLLVSAAIWVGLFNSIQIVVREREVIKLEYTAGRRLGCCVVSKGLVQMLLCLIESGLLLLAFQGVRWKYDNPVPAEGAVFSSALPEYYVSLFLLMYAADTMGIFLSCLVKKQGTANILSPYILILQLVFSGVLFPLQGLGDWFSCAMLSRWGMEALGGTSSLNDLLSKIQITVPGVPDREVEEMFRHTAEHLAFVWIVLAGFCILFLTAGALALRRVAKDTR